MKIEITKLIIDESINNNAVVSCYCNMTNGENTIFKIVKLDPKTEEEFVEINNFTEELVKSWIIEKLGEDGISQIEKELFTVKSSKELKQIKLPWVNEIIPTQEEYEQAQKEGRITRY